MAPVNLLTWICVTVSGLVSVLAFVGWSMGVESLYRLSSVYPPMTPYAAVVTFSLVSSFILLLSGYRRSGRMLAGILMVIEILLLFIFFDLLPRQLLIFTDVVASQEIQGDPIAFNALIVLICLTLSVLILSYKRLTGLYNPLALVCALLATSVCLLAVYGYLLGVEFAYWWPGTRPMAPNAAGALLALSIGFLSYSWTLFYNVKSKSREIVLGIQVASGSILFITALLSGAIVLIPMYETVLDKVYDNTKRTIEGKRSELSLFFSSIRTLSDSLGIQDKQFEKKPKSQSIMPDLKVPSVTIRDQNITAATLIPGIKSANFENIDSSAMVAKTDGGESNLDSPAEFPAKSGLTLKIVNEPNSDVELLALSNVVNSSDEIIGSLVTSVDLKYVKNLLTQNLGLSIQGGNFFIVPDSASDSTKMIKISHLNEKVEATDIDADLSDLLKALVPESNKDSPPSRTILRRDVISFLTPLSGTRAYLGFVSRVSPFRNIIHKRLINVLFGLIFLVLLATSFIFFLMRKLGTQILFLESSVENSLDQIAEELDLRKKAQTEIEGSLREKEVLLKEIHHRVKNNLQIITSILNLQLRRSEQSEVSIALRQSADRIQSIALLHETLYRSENFSSIDLEVYFTELVGHLVRSYSVDGRLKPKIKMCNINLELDRAIPLGLILTELVTNSLKYAFPANVTKTSSPELTVTCSIENDSEFVLEYRDNGIGLPKDFSIEALHSLGSRLVLTLVKQLDGKIDIASDGGVRIHIRFAHNNLKRENINYEKAANTDC